MNDAVLAEYRARTPGSARFHERATASLPGGETRAVTSYPPYPTAIATGRGARLTDVDGHEYVDLVNNYTSLVHGNAHPASDEAVAECLGGGLAFASVHHRQLELAELLTARIPSVERIRFTNSGSEAGVLAVRLARHVTGRTKVLLFDGAYHGSAPSVTSGGPGVVTVPFNDLDAAVAALDHEFAAVLVEPFLGAGGVVPAEPAFLTGLQELAREHGALLVLDEVQSLRNDVHGMQATLGLDPDLTLLGKIIGGGIPIGAVGGRAELLRQTATTVPGRLVHAGTFNGHLLAAAAGVATMEALTAEAITGLNRAAATLADQITAAGAAADLPVTVTRAGSVLNVHFTATAPTSAATVPTDQALRSTLHLALLNAGFYTTPRGMINLSTALTEDDLAATARAYADVFRTVRRSVPALTVG